VLHHSALLAARATRIKQFDSVEASLHTLVRHSFHAVCKLVSVID
jgi:hypothetical protein